MCCSNGLDLSTQQLEIVRTTARKVVVLAGAGSGKTRVLTARILHGLLERKLDSRELLVFSFTRKACGEISDRLTRYLPKTEKTQNLPLVTTFHAFAYRLILKNFRLLGFTQQPTILSSDGPSGGMQAFQEFWTSLPSGAKKQDPASIFQKLEHAPSQQRSRLLNDLDSKFLAWKKRRGLVEFRDQIPLALHLLNQGMASTLTTSFRWILVDEFQDIDASQVSLFDKLRNESTEFMVFGDDDQTIYRWRGADPTLIRNFANRADVTTYFLTVNYRSASPIVNLAAQVISQDKERIPKQIEAFRRETELPRCFFSKNTMELMVRELKRSFVQGKQPNEFAVLVRDHHDGRQVSRWLERAGIPVATTELDGIQVLTFHASKGLEFPYVILPFFERGRFPGTRRIRKHLDSSLLRQRALTSLREKILALHFRISCTGTTPATDIAVISRGTKLNVIRRLGILLAENVWFRQCRLQAQTQRQQRLQRSFQLLLHQLQAAVDAHSENPLNPGDCDQMLAEERRLCYVGITRAIHGLWIFAGKPGQQSEFIGRAEMKCMELVTE